MAVIISMLRGVNLGKRRVKMEALRGLYESLGLRDAQTLVQSGNVVFRTEQKGMADMSEAFIAGGAEVYIPAVETGVRAEAAE